VGEALSEPGEVSGTGFVQTRKVSNGSLPENFTRKSSGILPPRRGQLYTRLILEGEKGIRAGGEKWEP
jgi:hypothetical protein